MQASEEKLPAFFAQLKKNHPAGWGKKTHHPQYKHDAQASGLNSNPRHKPNTAPKTKEMGGTGVGWRACPHLFVKQQPRIPTAFFWSKALITVA